MRRLYVHVNIKQPVDNCNNNESSKVLKPLKKCAKGLGVHGPPVRLHRIYASEPVSKQEACVAAAT